VGLNHALPHPIVVRPLLGKHRTPVFILRLDYINGHPVAHDNRLFILLGATQFVGRNSSLRLGPHIHQRALFVQMDDEAVDDLPGGEGFRGHF